MVYRPAKIVSIPLAAAAMFVGVYVMTPSQTSTATGNKASPVQTTLSSTYYSGCNEARAAGAAPIYRGQPGYREEMDGDGDGIACEPHRGM